jgi:hypothetical protein
MLYIDRPISGLTLYQIMYQLSVKNYNLSDSIMHYECHYIKLLIIVLSLNFIPIKNNCFSNYMKLISQVVIKYTLFLCVAGPNNIPRLTRPLLRLVSGLFEQLPKVRPRSRRVHWLKKEGDERVKRAISNPG